MIRYHTSIWDNARWEGFEHRPGDIVISTPPKCGTTWTQMLCALLIFDGPDFPGPLGEISPWMDLLVRPAAEVHATYAAQRHRRFLKTHTPLDGLPLRKDVTYVVVGRDPRDVAISMEHHAANIDYRRFFALRDQTVGPEGGAPSIRPPPPSEDPAERLRAFVEARPESPGTNLESVLHHLSIAWERRAEPNVALFHYADYRADLPAELLRLADTLGMGLTAARAAELAFEASLERMRARAADVVPGAALDQWKDTRAFLRAGASGEWRERADDADRARYAERISELVPRDLAAWVHGGWRGSASDLQRNGTHQEEA